MSEALCLCMECRIRAAIFGADHVSEPFECDTGEALRACGEVLAELLAHHSTKSAKAYVAALLDARKKWQAHPRVAIQQPAAGHS